MLHGAFQILFAILNVEEREVGVTDGSASPRCAVALHRWAK